MSLLFAVVAGIFGANAVPHFVSGITQRKFPTPLGPSPVVNLVGGWAMLVIGGIALAGSHPTEHATVVAIGAGIGSLGMGLFHATIGAFGRAE
jgi:hypothetical protein